MAVIAVIQQKGGVGKSTITANVAGELLKKGRTVALIDLDPQESLTIWANLGSGLLNGLVHAVNTEDPKRFKAAIETARKGSRPGPSRLPPRSTRYRSYGSSRCGPCPASGDSIALGRDCNQESSRTDERGPGSAT